MKNQCQTREQSQPKWIYHIYIYKTQLYIFLIHKKWSSLERPRTFPTLAHPPLDIPPTLASPQQAQLFAGTKIFERESLSPSLCLSSERVRSPKCGVDHKQSSPLPFFCTKDFERREDNGPTTYRPASIAAVTGTEHRVSKRKKIEKIFV